MGCLWAGPWAGESERPRSLWVGSQIARLVLLGHGLHWRSKLDVLGVCLSSVCLKSWAAQWGVGHFTPQIEPEFPPGSGLQGCLWGLWWDCVPASPTRSFAACGVVTQPDLRFSKEEIVPHVAAELVCLWEENLCMLPSWMFVEFYLKQFYFLKFYFSIYSFIFH